MPIPSFFHRTLANITEETYSASIAFSSITIMFAFGIARPSPHSSSSSSSSSASFPSSSSTTTTTTTTTTQEPTTRFLDDLIQIFLLVKGWHKVVHVADSLASRQGASIFPSQHTPIDDIALAPETEDAFQRLEEFARDQGGYDRELYLDTTNSLKRVFITQHSSLFPNPETGESGEESPHAVLEWAHTLPEEFLRLVRERKGLALVILGFYAVVLARGPDVWWLRGWSGGLFGVVLGNVGGEYWNVLMWVKGELERGQEG